MKRLNVLSTLMILALTATPFVTVASDDNDNLHMRKKLQSIIIPKIQFADTSVTTVFEFLKQQSRLQDPKGSGVNFLLILKPQKQAVKLESKDAALAETVKEPKITMDMDNLPLEDAIRFVCTQAGLVHVVEPHAVVVMDKAVTREKLELRIFNVDPRVFKDVKDVKKFFQEKGVSFPVTNK